MRSAEEILNEIFGRDIDSLKSCTNVLDEFKEKQHQLQITIETSAQQTSSNLKQVLLSCQQLYAELAVLKKQTDGALTECTQHVQTSESTRAHFTQVVEAVKCKQNRITYLKWIHFIEQLSSTIESFVEKEKFADAVGEYTKLFGLCEKLQSSQCTNIKRFSLEKCKNHYSQLEAYITKNMEEKLCAIKYPFATGLNSPLFSDDVESQLKVLIHSAARLKSLENSSNESLLSHLLLAPLRKRFAFHFYGDRHTNNPDKPEWYLTQILNWLRDHENFIETFVQQACHSEGQTSQVDVKTEFCNGLLSLCRTKLSHSFDLLARDQPSEMRLAHLIDETLLFEREASTYLGNAKQQQCLRVLLEEKNLEHWLKLEEKFAKESTVELMSVDRSWESSFIDFNDWIEEGNLMFYVPRCVQSVITLLDSMTERHKSLQQPQAQAKFFRVLETVMHFFITEMKNQASVEVIRPESNHFCAIVNGAYYTQQVLQEWSTHLYFIGVHQLLSEENESGLFGDCLVSLERFIEALLDSLIQFIEETLEVKAKKYKNEKWHSMTSPGDLSLITPSEGAGSLLLFVKTHLTFLEKHLYSEVFETTWKLFARAIDRILFVQVVFESHFNSGGAAQLQHDIVNNLFLLFSAHTKKPELYFKMLKDSCTILNLLPGTAILLKEQLLRKAPDQKDIEGSLREMNVTSLTYSQANRLVNARIDWPKIS